MPYITSILLSVISGVLVYILQVVLRENNELKKSKKQHESALSNGVLSLLRLQLIEYYEKYMTREIIPLYILENWDDMFSAYQGLGGNGSVEKMDEAIKAKNVGSTDHENH